MELGCSGTLVGKCQLSGPSAAPTLWVGVQSALCLAPVEACVDLGLLSSVLRLPLPRCMAAGGGPAAAPTAALASHPPQAPYSPQGAPGDAAHTRAQH